MAYDDLPAGQELDALVAEKVMGWKLEEDTGATPFCPSKDIAAAWLVIEKFLPEKVVQVQYYNVAEHGWCWVISIGHQWSYAKTASLAICRAALRVVEHDS